LTRRACETFDLPAYSAADRISGGTLATLEDDLELLPSLQAGALSRLTQVRESKKETEDAVEVIRLSDFLPKTQPLTDFSETEIDEALEKLKQKLYALRELKRRVLWD
jgi:DNA-binding TFAR19-related protein (PDSD5 family)